MERTYRLRLAAQHAGGKEGDSIAVPRALDTTSDVLDARRFAYAVDDDALGADAEACAPAVRPTELWKEGESRRTRQPRPHMNDGPSQLLMPRRPDRPALTPIDDRHILQRPQRRFIPRLCRSRSEAHADAHHTVAIAHTANDVEQPHLAQAMSIYGKPPPMQRIPVKVLKVFGFEFGEEVSNGSDGIAVCSDVQSGRGWRGRSEPSCTITVGRCEGISRVDTSFSLFRREDDIVQGVDVEYGIEGSQVLVYAAIGAGGGSVGRAR